MKTRKRYNKDILIKDISELLIHRHKPLLRDGRVTDFNKLSIASFKYVLHTIERGLLYTAIIVEEEVVRKPNPRSNANPKPAPKKVCKISLKDVYGTD